MLLHMHQKNFCQLLFIYIVTDLKSFTWYIYHHKQKENMLVLINWCAVLWVEESYDVNNSNLGTISGRIQTCLLIHRWNTVKPDSTNKDIFNPESGSVLLQNENPYECDKHKKYDIHGHHLTRGGERSRIKNKYLR